MRTSSLSLIRQILFVTITILFLVTKVANAGDIVFDPVTPTRNSQFVIGLYQALLHRTPSTGEVAPFLVALKGGTTRLSVAQTVMVSTEYRTSVIQGLYSTLLGRSADADSLNVFLTVYANNGGVFDIRNAIFSSSEYFAGRGKGTNKDFLDALYADLLGRTPTSAEAQNFFIDVRLNGRGSIVKAILMSSEYRTRLITNLYSLFLGRTPGQLEINFDLALFTASHTEEEIEAVILGSEEYFTKISPPFLGKASFRIFLGSASTSKAGLDLGSLKTTVKWGDGHTTKGVSENAGDGSVRIFVDHIFRKAGIFKASVILTLGKAVVQHSFNLNIQKILTVINPFATQAHFGVRVAVGDVNGDGVDDIIAAAGPGSGPHVKVFNGLTGQLLTSFFAYDTSFKGGVSVAAGDVNGDGMADIITGAGSGGGSNVKIFSGLDGSVIASFFAFDSAFTGGVSVATGDINGDGTPDIIVAAGPGGGPHVKVFDGKTFAEVQSFFAYDSTFTGGVSVAAGDVNGDGKADIIVGPIGNAGPNVKVFSGVDGSVLTSFLAFASNFTGGVPVAAGDVNGDGRSDIIVGAGPGGGPHIIVFNGVDNTPLKSFYAFDANFTGGVFVAAGDVDGKGVVSVIEGTGGSIVPQIKIKRFAH